MPRITELYAWVVADTGPDDEGVPAFMEASTGSWLPMMGADIERAESLREHAVGIAKVMGKRVKLVRSLGLETVDVIDP